MLTDTNIDTSNHNSNTFKKSFKKVKTTTLSCRIDNAVLDKIQIEARQKEVTPNLLINQVLKSHTLWHSQASKAGFISIRKGLLLKLLEKFDEDQVTELADYIIKKDTKNFILLLRSQYNIESALDVIETWIKIAGYPYRHDVRQDNHSYVIQHDMGYKWSIYLVEQYKFIFVEFGVNEYNFDLTDNTLSFNAIY